MSAANQRTIAVVGASLGGLRTVDALRRLGWTERIVAIGDEAHMPYTRPPLSKKLLRDGGGDHAAVALRLKPSEHETQWVLGRQVTACDLAAKQLTLDDGSVVEFDGVVASTGVRPRRLRLDAPEQDRLVVRTLEDSMELSQRLTDGASVVIIGAGFIGCEVAAAAQSRGCQVSVIAIDEVPMQVPLGREVGAELHRRHIESGVQFHLGRGVSAIRSHGGAQIVVLNDGTELTADVVVEAIGSVPNVEWLDGNGLDLSDGVLCDSSLRLGGIAGAVGVGDIARFPNATFGGSARRVEHWQIPGETALRAAATLLADLNGKPDDAAPFATVPTFWSDQGVASIRAFGSPALGDTSEVLEGDLSGEVAIGYTREGALVGIVLLGMAKQQGQFIQRLNEALAQPANV